MSDSRRETSPSLSGQNRPSIMEVVQVDDIPVLVAQPDQTGPSDRLALWLHFPRGNKEAMAPFLQQLAAAGVTAVSFDAWQHGEQSVEPVADLMARAFAQFRRPRRERPAHQRPERVRVQVGPCYDLA